MRKLRLPVTLAVLRLGVMVHVAGRYTVSIGHLSEGDLRDNRYAIALPQVPEPPIRYETSVILSRQK